MFAVVKARLGTEPDSLLFIQVTSHDFLTTAEEVVSSTNITVEKVERTLEHHLKMAVFPSYNYRCLCTLYPLHQTLYAMDDFPEARSCKLRKIGPLNGWFD